ncbi:MAG: cation:proton antiporter, partial [Candidatus Paceibacterota bacterium]
MTQLIPFFIILFVGVFFSGVFKKLNLPWVLALIVGGIIVGPFALGLFEPNETIEFISQIGLVFLMFMAGLETKFSIFKEHSKQIIELAALNGLIPFLAGLGVGMFLGLEFIPALFVGIVFLSSSVSVAVPSLEDSGILGTRIGRSIIATTIIEDVFSLVLLSVLLQYLDPVASLPLGIFYVLLFAVLFVLRWVIPKLMWAFRSDKKFGEDLFQQEVRIIFTILIGTVIIFELLGLHPIIAGFFAGLVLSDFIKSDILLGKIRTLSYGIFIPTFFVVIGTKTNLGIFGSVEGALMITVIIILASLISKFGSGFLGGRVLGFNNRESVVIGASTIPQLSTTLAVVATGGLLGILSEELVTAMIILSIVTTFIGPFIIKATAKKMNLETLT